MELLLEAEADARQPSIGELTALLHEERARFAQPARLAFEHIYVARDRHADAGAELARLAARVAAGADPAALGDPFPRGRTFAGQAPREIAGVFGGAFADAVASLSPGPWSGAIESSFGLHLVRVSARTDERTPTVDEVREALRQRWRERTRAQLQQAGLARLRQRYDVQR
jgi:parvulin-like peptidyl-prolyl isomerase